MIRRLNYYHFYLRMVAYALPFLAFALSSCLGLLCGRVTASGVRGAHGYFHLLGITTMVWAFAAERSGVTSVDELFYERTGIRAAFAACTKTYAVLLGLLFFSRDTTISRLFLSATAALLLPMALIMRAVFRNLVRRYRAGKQSNRLLIIGADRFARRAAHRLVRGPLSFCSIVGYIAVDSEGIAVTGAPVYSWQDVPDLCRKQEVDEIVVAIPPNRLDEMSRIIKHVECLCVPVRAVVDVGHRVIVRERLFQCGGLQIFDLTATPAESVKYALLKRAFDVAFSLLTIILTAPLMAVLALSIRLTSPGPALFVHDRIGLNGKMFRMYKFRTMRMTPAEESDVRWTTANDPRRTPIGAFLRRTSLDEMPQFFNVLKGDMSVVGPRPERPHFVQKFLHDIARYNNRHRLKVGITGWAQVNGLRGDTSIRKRVNYDLYYLQNWSLAFDLRIIFLTLISGFSSKNAY